jgi:hypothetical protein
MLPRIFAMAVFICTPDEDVTFSVILTSGVGSAVAALTTGLHEEIATLKASRILKYISHPSQLKPTLRRLIRYTSSA